MSAIGYGAITTGAGATGLWLPATHAAYTTPTDKDIAWALGAFAARRAEYQLYADYLAGAHRRFWRLRDDGAEFTDFLRRVAVNFCPRIVAAFTDRLRIIGFEPHAEAAGDEQLAEAAWALWQDRRLERHFNQLFSTAFGLGDAYLIVWPDATGRAQFYPESPLHVAVKYDGETRAIALGAKLWADGRHHRLNLYYADRIERFITRADNATLPNTPSGFRPYGDAPNGGDTVINPYGRVPIFHFGAEAGVGQLGTSVLRPVLSIQDDYNVASATLAVVREYQAWPLRWAIGIDPEAQIEVGPDRLIKVASSMGMDGGDKPAFGQFAAADLTAYFNNKESSLMELAAVTGVPPHLLHRGLGTPPSGEALKTAEAPLASRVEKAQTNFGDEAENAIAFGLVIERRAASADDGAGLTALWQSAYTRSDRDEAETVAIKVERVGLSVRRGLVELGYSETEIDEILADKEIEREAASVALDRSMNVGGVPGTVVDITEEASSA